jgi:hypothetical protein
MSTADTSPPAQKYASRNPLLERAAQKFACTKMIQAVATGIQVAVVRSPNKSLEPAHVRDSF